MTSDKKQDRSGEKRTKAERVKWLMDQGAIYDYSNDGSMHTARWRWRGQYVTQMQGNADPFKARMAAILAAEDYIAGVLSRQDARRITAKAKKNESNNPAPVSKD